MWQGFGHLSRDFAIILAEYYVKLSVDIIIIVVIAKTTIARLVQIFEVHVYIRKNTQCHVVYCKKN